jgi:hypothetical protein
MTPRASNKQCSTTCSVTNCPNQSQPTRYSALQNPSGQVEATRVLFVAKLQHPRSARRVRLEASKGPGRMRSRRSCEIRFRTGRSRRLLQPGWIPERRSRNIGFGSRRRNGTSPRLPQEDVRVPRFESDIQYDAIQMSGQKIEFGSHRNFAFASPDRARIETLHWDGARELSAFDGERFSAALPKQAVYATIQYAGSVADAFEHLDEEYGLASPLFDLVRLDLADDLTSRVRSARLAVLGP